MITSFLSGQLKSDWDGQSLRIFQYNYEDQKTASLYFGRSFSFDKKANWEITPMIGGVLGKTNGLSPGFNFEFEYKRFSTFTQCQYTIDLKNINSSFFWNWTGFNINISNHFGLGGSVQFYRPNVGKPFNRFGPMISYHLKSFTIELYAYNFWPQHPSGAVGIAYQFKYQSLADNKGFVQLGYYKKMKFFIALQNQILYLYLMPAQNSTRLFKRTF